MSESLAIIHDNNEFLTIPHGLSFKDWWAFREDIYRAKKGQEILSLRSSLWAMDWYFHGESHYGEEHSQALDFLQEEMGWQSKTITDYKRVYDMFPPDQRYPNIPITFYQAVTALPRSKAHELIRMASQNNWTRAQLRKAVKHHTHPDEEPKVTRKDIERAAREVLRNLKPAGDHYELEEEPALELALVMDFALRALVVEAEPVRGQLELSDASDS